MYTHPEADTDHPHTTRNADVYPGAARRAHWQRQEREFVARLLADLCRRPVRLHPQPTPPDTHA
jgi:hypothetical protein